MNWVAVTSFIYGVVLGWFWGRLGEARRDCQGPCEGRSITVRPRVFKGEASALLFCKDCAADYALTLEMASELAKGRAKGYL